MIILILRRDLLILKLVIILGISDWYLLSCFLSKMKKREDGCYCWCGEKGVMMMRSEDGFFF